MLSIAAGRTVADREGTWVLVKALALATRERMVAAAVFMVQSMYWRQGNYNLAQEWGQLIS
jgi:hypothetical protein